ncbi:helix-turn-helix domain-containing protein [Oscillatoria salina]|uniref:helix-turn-helix domain-containing protein n=1 Tax=Oscillatoria salina TaxID=331517 RepID=UPI0013B9E944|nr:helix-turn-helix domain-containing protein [Oscillatoria salina]MBZ8181708.1 helix-turn-helix domain-containing protein [Oscillatoria salina IIICB1]NET89615.1 helix-turn-helix domain-containing protein [Kamptonema sp. SIO1D9]
MAYTIPSSCFQCGNCQPHCPTGAIQREGEEFWIEPGLCNGCDGYYSEPQCIVACPISSPVPLQAKKGRYKLNTRTATSPDLFPNGKNNSMASSIVIWEACNLLMQRSSLDWQTDLSGKLFYHKKVKQGRGSICFHIDENLDPEGDRQFNYATNISTIEGIDIRAACLHLIYAAYATSLEKPWEEEFAISDRQIEKYLGLDKRKDLNKAVKLTLIKDLAQQPCKLVTSIDWPQQGKVKQFSVPESYLWHLVEIKHHFQEDELGCKHLVGLTFKIKAGIWAKYFLNKQGSQTRTAFYQYGTLPKFLLTAVTSIWQQHEGAARMMLWLLFKIKMGKEQRITVPTLMRVAYGEERINQASTQREERKRLLRSFESDLEFLNHYGLKPVFDPVTYKEEIQPLWAKLAELPDDADEALEFWINDGSNKQRLTDSGPRDKWNLLMKARILGFDLPLEWEQQLAKWETKKQRKMRSKSKSKIKSALSAQQILSARKSRGISQRKLAQLTGKSQSWIRDLENGRLEAKPEDQLRLRQLLDL